jgi:hypothetical protein
MASNWVPSSPRGKTLAGWQDPGKLIFDELASPKPLGLNDFRDRWQGGKIKCPNPL